MANEGKFMKWILALVLVVIPCASWGQQLSQRITNQDVIDMVALGLSDNVIIQKLRTIESPQFDTSVQGLRKLKSGKVSDAVIQVMINPHAGIAVAPAITAPSPSSPQSGLPEEIGVYYMRNGEPVQLDPEIVGWQTGGVIKRGLTLGFDHGHINGKIMTPHSPLQLSCPTQFLIKTAEGTSVTEYQLLRLYGKGNRREFRALTGGVIHVKGGAERTAISFRPEKVGTRVWRIRLSGLERGEYGFLPHGVAASSIAAAGKVYSFGITGEDLGQSSGVDSPALDLQPQKAGLMSPSGQSVSASQTLFTSGGLRAGVLGVSGANWTEGRMSGVEIVEVVPGSPAAIAGLHVRDVITDINGRHIGSANDLAAVLAQNEPGSKITLGYILKTNLGWMPKETLIIVADK
jgi:hypothetical protein